MSGSPSGLGPGDLAGTPQDLQLRACRPRDYGVLLGWLPTAEDLLLFAGPAPSWPVTSRGLQDLAAGPGCQAYSLVTSHRPEEPLGHAELVLGATTAHLARVILDPDHRGRGWARHLVALVIERARQHGASTMTLHVIETNQPALRTYARLGFTPTGHRRPGVVTMGRNL